MSKVIYFKNGDNLKELVKDDKVVLVDFFSTTCTPCNMLSPVLDELSNEVDNKIIKVDVYENRDLAFEYNVRSIPTIVYFKDGKEVSRSLGFKEKDVLISELKAQ